MSKVIKSSLTARYVSLLEGSNHVSLFTQDRVACSGVYLQQHQTYSRTTNFSQSAILTIYGGVGELTFTQETQESVSLHIVSGDIIAIPHEVSFTIHSTSVEHLIISEVLIFH